MPQPTMSELRPLAFASVADAPAEAARLHADGYRPRGRWDLRQICEHLADWVDFGVDGYPPQPLPMRPALWIARHTVGPRMLRKILEQGEMSAGLPTDSQTVHPAAEDRTGDAAAVARFRASVDRFLAHDGEYAPSPLFGPVAREQARRLQAIHAAHHLRFLEPEAADSDPADEPTSARPASD